MTSAVSSVVKMLAFPAVVIATVCVLNSLPVQPVRPGSADMVIGADGTSVEMDRLRQAQRLEAAAPPDCEQPKARVRVYRPVTATWHLTLTCEDGRTYHVKASGPPEAAGEGLQFSESEPSD